MKDAAHVVAADRGFTLVELLVSVAVMVLVMSGAGAMYIANKNAQVSEDLSQAVESELRLGMERLTFGIRNARYGIPAIKLPMITWVTSIGTGTDNPKVTLGSGSDPDTMSIAFCTSKPIGYLTAVAATGATFLTVDADAAAAIDTASNKRVVYINENEVVYVTSKSGNTLTIDSDPTTGPLEPLNSPTDYVIGTPLCRVDVVTFSVDTSARKLLQNYNQGAGDEVVVDGITNMKIVVDTSGVNPKYRITLTARSAQIDPLTNDFIQRSLVSTASVRNN